MPETRLIAVCVLFVMAAQPAQAGLLDWLGKLHPVNRQAAAGGAEKGYTNKDLGLPDNGNSNPATTNITFPKFDDAALNPPKKKNLLQQVEDWIGGTFNPSKPTPIPADPFGTDAHNQSQGAAAALSVGSAPAHTSSANSNVTAPGIGAATKSAGPIVRQPGNGLAVPTSSAANRFTHPVTTETLSSPGPYLTARQALERGVKLQDLRPLTPAETIDSIGRGADTNNVGALRVVRSAPSQATTAAIGAGTAAATRPYLGAGQSAIDRSFSSTGGKVVSPTGHSNVASFGITSQDISSAKRTASAPVAAPSETNFSDAKGKPANAIEPQPERRPVAPAIRPAVRYRSPQYRQPSRQSGPDCAQLHAIAVQRLMMGDLSACYQLQAVCPAWVRSCG